MGHLFAWVSVALAGLFSFFYLRVPRVPYRALPLFHPGLCRSAALAGLFSFFYLRFPRVPYRALPSFHPGLCRSVALAGLFVVLGVCGVVSWYCVRCIYTLGVFACVGKCRSYGAQSAFICVYPGFHIGLCPYSTLGYAGVPPLQGSLSYWAFAELCRGIVFVKCVWVCQWIGAFVLVFLYLFDCDCMGCGGGLFGGIVGAVG